MPYSRWCIWRRCWTWWKRENWRGGRWKLLSSWHHDEDRDEDHDEDHDEDCDEDHDEDHGEDHDENHDEDHEDHDEDHEYNEDHEDDEKGNELIDINRPNRPLKQIAQLNWQWCSGGGEGSEEQPEELIVNNKQLQQQPGDLIRFVPGALYAFYLVHVLRTL